MTEAYADAEARKWGMFLHLSIYAVVSVILIFVLVGIPMLWALGVLTIVFPIIGAIKAGDGEVWKYPMTIKFF